MNNYNRSLSLILICHFISASSTLGLAPFFGVILKDGFTYKPSILIGLLYIIPTFLTALSSPFWGRLADRMNKKSAILRAQLGLSLSFLLASVSSGHIYLFILSLIMQGFLGGTLSAVNAYLAKISNKSKLSSALNLTQCSARLAFLISPVLIGYIIGKSNIFFIYTILSIITFISFLLILFFLRNDNDINECPNKSKSFEHIKQKFYLPYSIVLLGTFSLSFGLVSTFPYFSTFTNQHLQENNNFIIGVLFGLPHAVFLILILPIQNFYKKTKHKLLILNIGFLGLAISIMSHIVSKSIGGSL